MQLAVLAERVAKLHVQMAYGVLVDRSRRALGESQREFEAAQRAVAARATSSDAQENYLLLAILWSEYRGWLAKPAHRENVRKVADRADEVAWVAAKGARMLEPGAGSLAALARRGALLSQRAPRLYLMLRADPRNAELGREAQATDAELRTTLSGLAGKPQNSTEIESEIQVAETQYAFFARAVPDIKRAGSSVRAAEDIAKTGDHIHEAMQRVARRYEALGV